MNDTKKIIRAFHNRIAALRGRTPEIEFRAGMVELGLKLAADPVNRHPIKTAGLARDVALLEKALAENVANEA